MKKILFLLGFLVPFLVEAQKIDSVYVSGSTPTNRMVNRNDLQINGSTYLGIRDTTFVPNRNGAIVIRPQDQRAYEYTNGWFIMRTSADIFYLYLRSVGSTGDTLMRASTDTFYVARIRDSLSFHHVINPDGSWTMYSTGGSGGTFDTTTIYQHITTLTDSVDSIQSRHMFIVNIDTVSRPGMDTIFGARQNITYGKAIGIFSSDTVVQITDSGTQYRLLWSIKINPNSLKNAGPWSQLGNYVSPDLSTDSVAIGKNTASAPLDVSGAVKFGQTNSIAGFNGGLTGTTVSLIQSAHANGIDAEFTGYESFISANTGDSLLGDALFFFAAVGNPSGYLADAIGYISGGGSLPNIGNYTVFYAQDATPSGTMIGYESTINSGSGKHQLAFIGTGESYTMGSFDIGSSSGYPTAAFSITSTTQGVLFSRMNTTQQNAISSPSTGLLIFNTDSAAICVYNGTAWRVIGSGGGGGGGSLTEVASIGTGINPIFPRNDSLFGTDLNVLNNTGGHFQRASDSSTQLVLDTLSSTGYWTRQSGYNALDSAMAATSAWHIVGNYILPVTLDTVGINTATPGGQFEVNGNAIIDSSLKVNGPIGGIYAPTVTTSTNETRSENYKLQGGIVYQNLQNYSLVAGSTGNNTLALGSNFTQAQVGGTATIDGPSLAMAQTAHDTLNFRGWSSSYTISTADSILNYQGFEMIGTNPSGKMINLIGFASTGGTMTNVLGKYIQYSSANATLGAGATLVGFQSTIAHGANSYPIEITGTGDSYTAGGWFINVNPDSVHGFRVNRGSEFDSLIAIKNVSTAGTMSYVLTHGSDSLVHEQTYANFLSQAGVTSGSYTPTLTGTANIASTADPSGYYQQVGNIVHVTVFGQIALTAGNTSTQLTISKPITSSISGGIGIGSWQTNGNGLATAITGIIQGSSTTSVIWYFYNNTTYTGLQNFTATFDYSL